MFSRIPFKANHFHLPHERRYNIYYILLALVERGRGRNIFGRNVTSQIYVSSIVNISHTPVYRRCETILFSTRNLQKRHKQYGNIRGIISSSIPTAMSAIYVLALYNRFIEIKEVVCVLIFRTKNNSDIKRRSNVNNLSVSVKRCLIGVFQRNGQQLAHNRSHCQIIVIFINFVSICF